jgi:competence protein ComEC
VLIELPEGRRLLYDAGQLGLPSAAARTIAETLWFHGVTHLDALVISHADVDHYCALPHLMERFSIGHAYVSPRMFKDNDPDAVRALDRALREHGIERTIIHAGDRLDAGDDVQVEVLHPGSAGVDGSDNANSIVLAITYEDRRILLTGDLEPPGLGAVLNDAPLDCDVLMAPHHGSGGSDPPGLIEWCSPGTVVISGGRRDVSPAVTDAYAARGAKVFHTALDGAVTVTISNGAVRVAAYRQEELSSAARSGR